MRMEIRRRILHDGCLSGGLFSRVGNMMSSAFLKSGVTAVMEPHRKVVWQAAHRKVIKRPPRCRQRMMPGSR